MDSEEGRPQISRRDVLKAGGVAAGLVVGTAVGWDPLLKALGNEAGAKVTAGQIEHAFTSLEFPFDQGEALALFERGSELLQTHEPAPQRLDESRLQGISYTITPYFKKAGITDTPTNISLIKLVDPNSALLNANSPLGINDRGTGSARACEPVVETIPGKKTIIMKNQYDPASNESTYNTVATMNDLIHELGHIQQNCLNPYGIDNTEAACEVYKVLVLAEMVADNSSPEALPTLGYALSMLSTEALMYHLLHANPDLSISEVAEKYKNAPELKYTVDYLKANTNTDRAVLEKNMYDYGYLPYTIVMHSLKTGSINKEVFVPTQRELNTDTLKKVLNFYHVIKDPVPSASIIPGFLKRKFKSNTTA
jgi:hypothetical protein